MHYWQGLFAPFIVELFMVRFFLAEPRSFHILRFVRVATAKLPTPARVIRTLQAFHPNCSMMEFGPDPAGGFELSLTHFDRNGFRGISPPSISHSPELLNDMG